METTKAEAIDLLNQWHREERIIHYGTAYPLFGISCLGFITSLSETELVIGFEGKPSPTQPAASMKLNLTNVSCRYTDLREVQEEYRKSVACCLGILVQQYGLEILLFPVAN